jgi:ABC-type branched-subunit amino acid transport system substrate-binding protein/uncharacterized membrane protein YgcG
MARYAVDEINARWSVDTLTLDFAGTASSPAQIVSYYLSAAATSDVLAVLGTGDESLDSALSLVSAHAALPMITFSSEANKFNSSGFPYVSMHPNREFVFEAVHSLFGFFGFTRVGVLYSLDGIELLVSLRNYFASQMTIEFIDIALPEAGASLTSVMEALISQNVHVVMILSGEEATFHSVLQAADRNNLLTPGKGWLCFSPIDHLHLHDLPAGVMVVHESEAPPDRLAAFEDLVHSLDPATYPGTGPTAELHEISILGYDTFNLVAAAIEAVKEASLPVTRANFLAQLRTILYQGSSGAIAFDSYGSRKYGTVNFDVSVGIANELQTFLSFNGTIQSRFAPIWPGGSTTPPNTELQKLPITVLSQMDHGLQDPTLVAPTIKAYSYAISRLNSLGVIPTGYQVVPYVYDHMDSSLSAVSTAASTLRIGAVAAIGSSVSRLSVLAQAILGGTKIPQISHSTTEPDLSEKELFPTFMRVCNEANIEAQVMLDIISYWGWGEVTVVDFESDVAPEFIAEAAENGVKIVKHVIVEVEADDEGFVETFNGVAEDDPHIVVILVGPENVLRMASALHDSILRPRAVFVSYSFVFSNLSRYAQSLNFSADFFNGWIAMGQPLGQGALYDELLAELEDLPASEYPGVASLVAEAPIIQRAFEAALVIGDAIGRLVGEGGDPRDGELLFEAMLKTDLPGITGTITFTPDGDRSPLFSIRNVQNGQLITIGSFSNETGLAFNGQQVIWPDGTTNVPLDRDPRTVTWLSWQSGAGIALGVVAALGMAFCVFVLIVIYWQRNSPVIMSSTWEFLIVMIVGAMVGFGSVFIWVGMPSAARCALRVWFTPMAFILIVSPLLAKTWRLHRIFSLRDLKTNPIPLSRLVMMVIIMILIQIIICVFWISLGTVRTRLNDAQDDPKLAYLVCDSNRTNSIAQYTTYGYLGLLVLVCCYLAFRVRKLPKDFNESRWIAVAIYNILIFVVLLMILGWALRKFPVTFHILLCVATIIISLGSVTSLMLPKLWELLMHPERRSSSSGGGSQGSTKAKTTNSTATRSKGSNNSKGESHSGGGGGGGHTPTRSSNYSLGVKDSARGSPASSPNNHRKSAISQSKRDATPLTPIAPINAAVLDDLDNDSSLQSDTTSSSSYEDQH